MFRSMPIVLAATLAACLLSSQPAAGKDKEKAKPGQDGAVGRQAETLLLYVWDSHIPGDTRATRRLLQFAASRGFNTLALESAPLGYGQPGALERYRSFSLLARAAGMRVLALSGYPWFTVSAKAGLPGQPTAHEEGWSLYTNCLSTGLFDGLLDDSNPVLTDYVRTDGASGNYFWEHPAWAAQDYLTWLRGLAAIAGSRLHVQAVPMWFDEHPAVSSLFLEGETTPHSLAWYVARHVDLVNVLAYRDRAGEILAGASDELQLGPVLIGVETRDLGPGMDEVTFFEEGRGFMERELMKVWEQARGSRGFRGLTVHHYDSLRAMDGVRRREHGAR